jgi:urease subunit alpha
VHEGNPALPDDVVAARELVHPATMEAEGPLHDLGAISIVNSDSQGMGRIGETVRRTFQLAHVMKVAAAPKESGDHLDDNDRVLRYLAKVTEEPARVHGISDEVGSLSPGRIADLVLWEASHFGVKPVMVFKGGVIAWTAMGEGNASVHGAEPTRYGPDWGGTGLAPARVSTTFVSAAAIDAGIARTLGTRRRLVAVRGTRTIRRDGLARNRTVPPIEVSAADGTVTLDGRVLRTDPVTEVRLSRRYLLA